MSEKSTFRGPRMREAMDRVGLSSGQVGYRMNVTGAAVRSWTTGKRGIDPDDLVRFAQIVGYPVQYFLYEEYALPPGFTLNEELKKLSELSDEARKLLNGIDALADMSEHMQGFIARMASEPGYEITSDEQAIAYLRDAHNLDPEAVAVIRRIIQGLPPTDN